MVPQGRAWCELTRTHLGRGLPSRTLPSLPPSVRGRLTGHSHPELQETGPKTWLPQFS